MDFEIISDITNIERIAVNQSIREIRQLRRKYGSGRWRKLKGATLVLLPNGRVRKAEIQWYEAHGIGKRKIKVSRFLD
ncbi:MAG: hypothetical protein B6D41_01560 [Chloroflexi bacterium UTCFX4]|jgi:hypothetical protein|nr:MAG: hypothetical protein B6D41_01560 [Chloroflexi bacterium UTCFX4]